MVEEDGTLRIGALVTHAHDGRELRSSGAQLTALADASAIVGSHATRAFGTIGGNLMNASPAMEAGGPLLCLDAVVVLRSQSGSRELGDRRAAGRARTYDRGPRTSCCPSARSAAAGSRLGQLPTSGSSTGARWRSRSSARRAVVRFDGVAVADARVAITALAPTIRRVPDAEAALVGSDGGVDAVAAAGQAVGAAAEPISDVRGSAGYRQRDGGGDRSARRSQAALGARRGEDVPIPASPRSTREGPDEGLSRR